MAWSGGSWLGQPERLEAAETGGGSSLSLPVLVSGSF